MLRKQKGKRTLPPSLYARLIHVITDGVCAENVHVMFNKENQLTQLNITC